MSELTEATQIVALSMNMMATGAKGFYKLTELGIAAMKAIVAHTEKRMHEKLSGEVSLEQLVRFEGSKLSTARFEEISMDELKPVLDSYGIPYVVMPESEVNGLHYTSVTFGNSYTDRMAAVIQNFGGRGSIVRENSVPKYITSGEVSLELLQEQDGPQLMVYQFPEKSLEDVLPVMNKSGLKYAVLPDLNLGDGQSEIAFPASQRELIQKTMERLVDAKILSMKQYFENADPKDVKSKAQEYERSKVTEVSAQMSTNAAETVTHMSHSERDYKAQPKEQSEHKKSPIKERSIEDSYIPPIL